MPPRVEHWIAPEAVHEIEYADYWNDEVVERDKEWYVLDGDFAPMERYLEEVGLLEDLRTCLAVASRERERPLQGVGLDLAAGNLWAARHLLAAGDVECLYCVEYSSHRLLKLGPAVLDHYGVPAERVVLALGSFYDLHLEDESVDFALMSQALHHADDPERLLRELRRVLRPDGVVIAIGEHVVAPPTYALRAARLLAGRLVPRSAQRRLLGHEIDLRSRRLVPDAEPLAGDHYYGRREYARMFRAQRFRHRRVRRRGGKFQGFVLTCA